MKKKFVGIIVSALFIMQMIPVAASTIQSSESSIDDVTPTEPLMEGPVRAKLGEECTYTVRSTDPQGEPIYYRIEFSDAPRVEITRGPIESGEKLEFKHTWNDFYQDSNPFIVRVVAFDDDGHESTPARFYTKITDIDAKSKDAADFNWRISNFFEIIFDMFLSNNFDNDFSNERFDNSAFGNIFNKAR